MADTARSFRRLVFSLLVSNYDDHPRNHGFLMMGSGRWALSPAYDINPVPEVDRGRMNKVPLAEDVFEPSIAGALQIADRFGLKLALAKAILREVQGVVCTWRATARHLGISPLAQAAYETAF